MSKPVKDVRINIKLNTIERVQFKEHCKKLNINMSERIRELIEKDIKSICQTNQ